MGSSPYLARAVSLTHVMKELFDFPGEEALSSSFSPSYSFRAKRRAIRLAQFLLNDEGKLHRLDEAARFLEERGNLPFQYSDAAITAHMKRVVSKLREDRFLASLLSQFTLPIHPEQESQIAATLGIERLKSDRDLIWGILSALLCPLRQSVGSCFATAPAILIHEHYPELFLTDLQALLTKGVITRVIAGTEYTVPISPSPGIGTFRSPFLPAYPPFEAALSAIGLKGEGKGVTFEERLLSLLKGEQRLGQEEQEASFKRGRVVFVAFTEHLLLKTWEFTLASLVDVKTEFSGWNLYASLGLRLEEPGGIGSLTYQVLNQRLEEANQELQKKQVEFEISYDQVKATERLIKSGAGPAEGRRLKNEHQARVYELLNAEKERDKWALRAEKIAHFYNYFLDQIIEQFPKQFQEAYDPEMRENSLRDYDDCPAGFRLLNKHGRTHAPSWSFIRNGEEYTRALRSFFVFLESSCRGEVNWEGGEELLSHLITTILHHIDRREFLPLALSRVATAHKNGNALPWAYTSGGTLPTLLKTYFRREGEITEISRWVESPEDLLIFFLETLKGLPPVSAAPFLRDSSARMLATSPTHAFSLLPGLPRFRKGWEDAGFTYTWVRDTLLRPGQAFWKKSSLTPADAYSVAEWISRRLTPAAAQQFLSTFSFREGTLQQLRAHLQELLPPQALSLIDQTLYERLPIIHPEQMKGHSHKIPPHPMDRLTLHNFLVAEFPEISRVDAHKEVASLLRTLGFAPPEPLIVGDTNWPGLYFAFGVHPSLGTLDLLVTDIHGITGSTLPDWRSYLDGTNRSPWTLLPYTYEYGNLALPSFSNKA